MSNCPFEVCVKARELSYRNEFKKLRLRSNMLLRAASEVGLGKINKVI